MREEMNDNKNDVTVREGERDGKKDTKKRHQEEKETTYVLRRAPSGYSRDGVRSFFHFISALKMLL